MIDASLSALAQIFSCPCIGGVFPATLFFMLLGVIGGMILGIIPGLGGLVGMAIVLPFAFDMSPIAAISIMVSITAVTNSTDSIPSILFGIPGTVSAQATILDGHPMALKGEAGRAFGATYMASLLGGLFSAVLLVVLIPVLRPLALAFGTPELFMLGLLGISMVGVLSGRAPLKGVLAGLAGLLVGVIGLDPMTGVQRWTFGELYLWDGVPIVAAALGVFAIPEIIDLTIRGSRISQVPKDLMKGVRVGLLDPFRHWFLLLRCSAIGMVIGIIPGLGGSVADWFAYGHALQTEKRARETFGKGDVRGVIAPESCANSKEGGALVPTLAFGIPGTINMVMVLAVLIIHGIVPGPAMLTEHLDLTFGMVWTLVIANVVATILAMMLTSQMAKLTLVPIHLLAPFLIAITFLAAYQATQSLADLIVLLVFAFAGWIMKRVEWPRPPLILGLVLSVILERNFSIASSGTGLSWMGEQSVLVIAALIVVTIAYGIWSANRGKRKTGA